MDELGGMQPRGRAGSGKRRSSFSMNDSAQLNVSVRHVLEVSDGWVNQKAEQNGSKTPYRTTKQVFSADDILNMYTKQNQFYNSLPKVHSLPSNFIFIMSFVFKRILTMEILLQTRFGITRRRYFERMKTMSSWISSRLMDSKNGKPMYDRV